MAKFCTKCGSPLSDDIQFCMNCGAPISAPAATPAAPASAATPVAAPAAAKSGSPVVKIVLIVVGVLILLTAISIGSCVYIAYRVKQKSSAIMQDVSSGRISFGTHEVQIERGGEGTAAEAEAIQDVPLYPGSSATEGGGSLATAGFGIAAQEYVTSDEVDKVVEFYKDKFGNKLTIHQSGGNAVLQLKTGEKGLTTISVSRDEGAGRTKINIMRFGK